MSEVKVIVEGEGVDDTKDEPSEWEICSWADTICKAEEIKLDPDKMKLVGPYLAKKKKAMANVKLSGADMKAKAADMPMNEEEY